MFGIDDAILGGALSFGGKLLSGLGASKAAKSAQKVAMAVAGAQQSASDAFYTAEHNQIQAWNPVADAQRFGFNPVTWINSGSQALQLNSELAALEGKKAGYMSSFSTVSNMPNKVSPLSALGDAVSAGVGTWSTMHDNAASVQQKRDALSQTLAAVQQARASGNPLAGIGTPSFQTSGPALSGGGAAAALSLGKDALGIKDRSGEVSQIFSDYPVDSTRPDAMAVERRYGFFPAMAAGAANLAMDNYFSWTRQSADELSAGNPGFRTRFQPGWQNGTDYSAPISVWHPSTWGARPGADTGEQTWNSAPALFGQ